MPQSRMTDGLQPGRNNRVGPDFSYEELNWIMRAINKLPGTKWAFVELNYLSSDAPAWVTQAEFSYCTRGKTTRPYLVVRSFDVEKNFLVDGCECTSLEAVEKIILERAAKLIGDVQMQKPADAMSLQPGPELDAAVARACGFVGKIKEYHGDLDGTPRFIRRETWQTSWDGSEWSPCADLDAAFEAAEKVGLFSTYGCVLGMAHRVDAQTWAVVAEVRKLRHDEPDDDVAFLPGDLVGEPITTAPTPALAICRAILKVIGQQ